MREVQLRDAKASLSALVDEAARGQASVITRHGKARAVIIGIEEWERLRGVPSFARMLLSAPVEAGDLPERSAAPSRPADV